MVRKRLDDRVRALMQRGVESQQRSMLVLVGDHGKDQVPNLHYILTRVVQQSAAAHANNSAMATRRPKVLWCYKKDLGFSTHKKKRMKKLKRDKQRGLHNNNADPTSTSDMDTFELFMSQTDINWCYYKDSHRVLGTTVNMLILQDFEGLTPNLLARTIETVAGGGLVIFLLKTVTSLKQLYQMTMDVHSRYRTEAAGDIQPRFNERFLLSLAHCQNCLVCDDELNVLPISKKALKGLSSVKLKSVDEEDRNEDIISSQEEKDLAQLKESLIDTPHVGALVDLAKTLDQAKALLIFMEACSDNKSVNQSPLISTANTVAMTAARGRGKSAAIGLSLAGAVSLGYSNICVTAPAVENLVSVFDFCLTGLKALKYQEHLDYRVTYNNATGRDATKCVTSIQITRTHRQIIQYIDPNDADKFASAEIVAIDEAAAIPLPIVRSLILSGSSGKNNLATDRLTFISSTVNGYEGTGRALSLKLIHELRRTKGDGAMSQREAAQQAAAAISGPKSKKGDAKVHEQRWNAAAAAVDNLLVSGGGRLREMELNTPIRYAQGDAIESWLNKLLCLDCGSASNLKLKSGAPAPADCELYSVNRDALFSFHKLSESFLQKLMGLYTSAHYKNTPNDLQMLSDAPAHHLFVLLSPAAERDNNKSSQAPSLPDVLAIVQVALEGRISRKAVEAQLARGHRSAGDLIPWTISQQFGDSKFAQLSGARVVRVAVHPSVQGMGYGSRAIELLYRFYNGEMISLADNHDDEDEGEQDHPQEEIDSDEDDDGEDGQAGVARKGILAENLKPRKELPPLLLPLTEVEAPRLDWIGTSFGLTLPLQKFWNRAGMKMLYLRQTTNELTGEHSAIMVRALPKRTGVDDAWIHAFLGDVRRRFITLLSGAFRDMEIRLAIAVLENIKPSDTASGNSRTGSAKGRITADELDYFLTPHDLKRLEQYGRNLCDHHLVSDLLPTVARLHFTGRFGSEFTLSSVQSALLCGIGLQNRTVDSLSNELGLPSNQVLAMFNKSIRKISIVLNSIVEEKEKQALISGEQRKKAEETADKMRDVAADTLEEDVADAAKEAMLSLKASETVNLPQEIAQDPELMQYIVKGSDEQWQKALVGTDITGPGTIQIQEVREKRKALDEEDISREASKSNTGPPSRKKGKKSGNKKKSRN